jgi:hypothetical protein
MLFVNLACGINIIGMDCKGSMGLKEKENDTGYGR